MKNLYQLYKSKWSFPEGQFFFVKNWLTSGCNFGTSTLKLHGCLYRLQSDSDGIQRWGAHSLHNQQRYLLLQSNAIRFKKYRSYLSTASQQNIQSTNWAKYKSLRWWYTGEKSLNFWSYSRSERSLQHTSTTSDEIEFD